MAEKVGAIFWDLDLDDSKFDKKSGMVDKKVEGLRGSFQRAEDGSRKFALALAAVGSALLALTFQGIKTAANLESIRQGFITLTGDVEHTDKVIARLKKEAKRTPFELEGLAKATQLLTSITKNGDKALDLLLDVGEGLAAMGRGQAELDRIILNLQQIGAVGKASMLDIKQFAFAGIPIFDMLKKETGLSGKALNDFIKDGKVTFGFLTKLFDKATQDGGRFFNAFKNQQGTFNQLWANMQDSVNIFLAEFVETSGIFDFVKEAIKGFTNILNDLQDDFDKAGGAASFFKQKFEENRTAIVVVAGAILGSLVPAFVGLGISIWAALAPLLPFIAAGAAIAFLLDQLVQQFGGWQVMIDQVTLALQSIWNVVGPIIIPIFQELWRMISQELWPAFQELWNLLSPVLIPVLKLLAIIIGVTLLIPIVAIIAIIFIFVKVLTLIVQALNAVIKAVVKWAQETWAKIQQWWKDVGKAFDGVKDFIGKLIERFKKVPEDIGNAIGNVFNAITTPFKEAFDWIAARVKEVRQFLEQLNPFHRNSPSLVDMVSRGTREMTGLYDKMFQSIGTQSTMYHNITVGATQPTEPANTQASVVNVTLNPSGIIARSRGELRDIATDMIEAVNEGLRARGVAQIGGSV